MSIGLIEVFARELVVPVGESLHVESAAGHVFTDLNGQVRTVNNSVSRNEGHVSVYQVHAKPRQCEDNSWLSPMFEYERAAISIGDRNVTSQPEVCFRRFYSLHAAAVRPGSFSRVVQGETGKSWSTCPAERDKRRARSDSERAR